MLPFHFSHRTLQNPLVITLAPLPLNLLDHDHVLVDVVLLGSWLMMLLRTVFRLLPALLSEMALDAAVDFKKKTPQKV